MQLLNQTIDEAMQKAGFSQKFINEIVTPVMRVNYGQGANVNGFVGMCQEIFFFASSFFLPVLNVTGIRDI